MVESDFVLALQAIEERKNFYVFPSHLLKEILALWKHFHECQFFYVSRNGNTVAQI